MGQVVRHQATLALFDQLDALSRQRALTDHESRTLEQVQILLIRGPRSQGLNRELARRGILQNRRQRALA